MLSRNCTCRDSGSCSECNTEDETKKSGCFGKLVWLVLALIVLGGAVAGVLYFLE